MRFYTTVKLGPNRELTPAGFTIFRNVSIARTGEQIYGPGETDIEPGEDGFVRIMRTPEEVFRPETLASLNGAPLTINHPIEDVTPENWAHLANGTFFNVRRGTGDQSDEMVADLMVTTPLALAEIDSDKREVSAGYDADYFQTGPGRGEQRNIIGNHVALVDQGRCGPQCAVRDHAHTKKGNCMAAKKSIKDRILQAFKTKDEAELNKAMDELEEGEGGEGGEHHVHVHLGGGEPENKAEDEDPTEKRFKALETGLTEIKDCLTKMQDRSRDNAPEDDDEDEDGIEDEMCDEAEEGEREEAKKAKDSAFLVDSWERVKSDAEIIAPGVKIPTFDAALDPKKSFKDCICALRKTALRRAINDADTVDLVEEVHGRTLDSAGLSKLSVGKLRSLFNGVAALKRAQNNANIFRDGASVATRTTDGKKPAQDAMTKFKAASKARWSAKK